MTTTAKKGHLPPALVSNLQEALVSRKGGGNGEEPPKAEESEDTSSSVDTNLENDSSKPVILVTNGDGIDSPGLIALVEGLVREGCCSVYVCAPQNDKSLSAHSVTIGETLSASSVTIKGAMAYEISGTPADCVSLALSGALFSWSKPALVISGINKGSNCGQQMFYSGAVAGAREALLYGVPSLSISLNCKKDESHGNTFENAFNVCLPLILAAIRYTQGGLFPRSCFLNIEVPTSPSSNKGFKITRCGSRRFIPNWLAVSANRHSSGPFMSKQPCLGLQLAQLSRDASAVGAARRQQSQSKNVEIESVAEARKPDAQTATKYFRLEFLEKDQEAEDEELDFRALENGFVAITPMCLSSQLGSEMQAAVWKWLADALAEDK